MHDTLSVRYFHLGAAELLQAAAVALSAWGVSACVTTSHQPPAMIAALDYRLPQADVDLCLALARESGVITGTPSTYKIMRSYCRDQVLARPEGQRYLQAAAQFQNDRLTDLATGLGLGLLSIGVFGFIGAMRRDDQSSRPATEKAENPASPQAEPISDYRCPVAGKTRHPRVSSSRSHQPA